MKSFIKIKNMFGKIVQIDIKDIKLLFMDYNDGSLTINKDVYYFSAGYAEKKFKEILSIMFNNEYKLIIGKKHANQNKEKYKKIQASFENPQI